MAKYNLKRVDLFVPQYDTDATITIDENHSSGQPHLTVKYRKSSKSGHSDFAIAIPDDWTDQDLAELITLRAKPRPGRDWPSWEVPSNDYASFWLFRWWKGEKPRTD